MPENSYIRFEKDQQRSRFLPILHCIYCYESEKISGSHIGLKRFNSYAWTIDQMLDYLVMHLSESREELTQSLNDLIEYMIKGNHLYRIKCFESDKVIHATRVAETVRTSGNVREFVDRDVSGEDYKKRYPIIEGSRWEPRLKKTLPRDVLKHEIIAEITRLFPANHTLPDSLGGVPISTAVEDFSLVMDVIDEEFKPVKLSEFQVEGITAAFAQSWTNTKIRAMVVTAGTGLGKTLTFAIPVLTDALIRTRLEESKRPKGTSQILLYPRNDLAKDQHKTLNDLLKKVNVKLVEKNESNRCFGIAIDAAGQLSKPKEHYPYTPIEDGPIWGIGKSDVYRAATSVYNTNPASIVICSIESFRRRLRNPNVCSGLKHSLSRVVIDEVHLSSGTQGAHHSLILSRLKQIIFPRQKDLTFIGASATIADARKHVGALWGCHHSYVEHVDANNNQSAEIPLGIVNHVLYRPKFGTSTIGAVVDITSAVGHQRRPQGFGASRGRVDKLQKMVAFSDSHEIVANWYKNLIQNESTEDCYPTIENQRRPYSHWFDRPLRFHDGGEKICKSCEAGVHAKEPLKLTTEQLEQFMLKMGNKEEKDIGRFYLDYPPEQEHEIRGLETCPHLQTGTCWHFARRSDDSEPRPGDKPNHTFQDVLRAKRHTSKTKQNSEDIDGSEQDAGANSSFREYAHTGAYSRPPPRPENGNPNKPTVVTHDVAIATPTLEVGVDMDYVSEVLTHKAIRNVSSYRQKIGRAGREPGTDAMAVTILGLGSNDFHHYRSTSKLIDRPIKDAVPIAKNNKNVIANESYEAVFDFFAMKGIDVEYIPALKKHQKDQQEELNRRFKQAIRHIDEFFELERYVKNAVKTDTVQITRDAINTVKSHLDILLQPMAGLDSADSMTIISWIACLRTGEEPRPHDPNIRHWDALNLLSTFFNESLGDIWKNGVDNKNVEAMRNLRDSISNGEITEPSGWVLAKATIDQMKDSKMDSAESQEIRQITRGQKNKANRKYVSCLLRNLNNTTKDAPYCSLPALFVNPNEAPVVVTQKNPEKGTSRSESVTANEALRYLLPGMWTHRLWKGDNMYVMHSGDAQLDGSYFMLDMDGAGNENVPELSIGEALGQKQKRVSRLLPIRISKDAKMAKIKQLFVTSDYGLKGKSTQINLGKKKHRGLWYRGDGRGDFDEGDRHPGKRPSAYSVNWVITELLEEGTDITTLHVMNMDKIDGAEVSCLATKHPRICSLFSDIKFYQKMEVSRLGLGVSRSNGPILVPRFNGKQIGFQDKFVTEGIRFTLSSQVIGRLCIEDIVSEIPYNNTFLDFLGSYLITNDVIDANMSGFALKSYLDLVNDAAYKFGNSEVEKDKFPDTAVEFINLVYGSSLAIEDDDFTACAKSYSLVDDDRLSDLIHELRNLHINVCVESESLLDNLSEKFSQWKQEVFLNTMGVLIVETGAKMAGVSSDAVGYTYTLDAESKTGYIDLFDDDASGNGSSELCKNYFFMPQEIRDISAHMGYVNIPSDSFLSLFEEKLGICDEHVLHSIALSSKNVSGMKRWMANEVSDLREHNGNIWHNHEVTSTKYAVLMNRRRFSIAESNETMLNELEISLNLCASGCVSCQGDYFSNLFPPHIAQYCTNRGIVDEILEQMRHESYLKEVADQQTILSNVGKPVASNLIFGGISTDGIKIVKRPVRCHTGVRTTQVWERGQEAPDYLDWWSRTSEVI
jgi:superfamily II DNA/RNA helicase